MKKIRLATIDDAKDIAYLGRTTFSETFGDLFQDNGDLPQYLEKTYADTKIASSFQNDNNVFFMALVNNTPVGYAKLKIDSSTPFIAGKHIAQLQKIYVLQEYLSLKIGHGLQNAVFETAQHHKAEKIWLSVYKGNERAIRFYQKNDFSIVGHHNFSIGSHDFEFLGMAKEF